MGSNVRWVGSRIGTGGVGWWAERGALLGSAAGMGSDPSLLIWRAPDAALLATRRAATASVAPPLPSVMRSISALRSPKRELSSGLSRDFYKKPHDVDTELVNSCSSHFPEIATQSSVRCGMAKASSHVVANGGGAGRLSEFRPLNQLMDGASSTFMAAGSAGA